MRLVSSNHQAARPIEHLSLVGKRPEHAIEGADAVGDDDVALAVRDVAVTNLALVLPSERFEVGAIEGSGEPLLQDLR